VDISKCNGSANISASFSYQQDQHLDPGHPKVVHYHPSSPLIAAYSAAVASEKLPDERGIPLGPKHSPHTVKFNQTTLTLKHNAVLPVE